MKTCRSCGTDQVYTKYYRKLWHMENGFHIVEICEHCKRPVSGKNNLFVPFEKVRDMGLDPDLLPVWEGVTTPPGTEWVQGGLL